MNIYEKLLNIQAELKAPKNQYNSFGKYNYRSCEDILEGLKPLLEEHKATLIVNDEIVQIGERYYVMATATLIDIEGEETLTKGRGTVSATVYAREDEKKTGMDLSQLTGSTSSYARKYALNGLFAIDDTKDSDATNTHDKEQNKAPATKKKEVKADENKQAIVDNSLASDAQVNYINKLIENKGYGQDAMINYIKSTYNKSDLKALNKKEAGEVINMLNGLGGN